jgi:hypothetical protein
VRELAQVRVALLRMVERLGEELLRPLAVLGDLGPRELEREDRLCGRTNRRRRPAGVR